MSFQIQKIILYSNAGRTQVLPFRTNSVNIITGASKTGKSALITHRRLLFGTRDK